MQGELFEVGERLQKLRTCTPAPIGSGPEGRRCGDCAAYSHVEYHDKTYRKCAKMQRWWTHGAGSDIRAKWPACREFEPEA